MDAALHVYDSMHRSLSPSTEGECSSFAPGVIMRSGTGSHTSASGIIYTGEWHEDKVWIHCVCTDYLSVLFFLCF